MEWLANLNPRAILAVAFALVFLRVGLLAWGRRVAVARGATRSWGELIEAMLVAWVVVFLIIRPFLFEQFSIPSGSMIPTLNIGDRIAVNKYDYRLHPPQRGDIVVFRSPLSAQQNEADFVKRLIGLPGDTIDLQNGHVTLNGRPLREPYVTKGNITESEERPDYPASLHFPYRVPPHAYLVMGDNRQDSFDSRGWGVVAPERIKGKAVVKLWPLGNFGLLR